jgi:hypothetical protein
MEDQQAKTAAVMEVSAVGDIMNVFVLSASLVYTFTVIYFTRPGIEDGGGGGFIDDAWKKDGFCIQNIDIPFWSSFDTCLYVDVIFSIVLFLMYQSWKDIPGMETSSNIVPSFIAGTLGHGIAHAAMAVKLRDGSYGNDDENESPVIQIWQAVVFCVVFWFPLLTATMPKMKKQYVFYIASIVTFLQGGLKKELGFAYVQTIISLAFHTSQLMLSTEEKNRREYITLPLSALLPIVTSWNEILFCESYFRSMGGHVLYDASIIISYIVFYLDCYRYNTRNNRTAITKQKTL